MKSAGIISEIVTAKLKHSKRPFVIIILRGHDEVSELHFFNITDTKSSCRAASIGDKNSAFITAKTLGHLSVTYLVCYFLRSIKNITYSMLLNL